MVKYFHGNNLASIYKCSILTRVFQYPMSLSTGMSSSLEVVIRSSNSKMLLKSMVLK